MLNLKGVLHWTLPVSNAARSEKFYSEILGMKVIQTAPQVGMVFLRCGRDYFVLAETKQPLCVTKDDDNAIHHAFIVEADEFDDAVAKLKANGIRIFHEYDRPLGIGAFAGRSAHFHDPDGNVLEIIDLLAPIVRPRGQTTEENLKGSRSVPTPNN